MSKSYQPSSLQLTSIRAFSKYVLDVCTTISSIKRPWTGATTPGYSAEKHVKTTLPQIPNFEFPDFSESGEDSDWAQEINEICQEIRAMITLLVHSSLANTLTNYIMREIDELYQYCSPLKCFEKYFKQVAKSVIHPSTTAFGQCEGCVCSNVFHECLFHNQFIYDVYQEVAVDYNLQVCFVRGICYKKETDVSYLKHVQVLSVTCQNDTLQKAINTNTQLRYLKIDLNFRDAILYNNYVDAILELKHLEHLCINFPQYQNMDYLISRLYKLKQLKYLSLCTLTSNQLKQIVKYLPNLLGLYFYNFMGSVDAIFLKEMQLLRSLVLTATFPNIFLLFKEIHNQFVHLQLNVTPTEEENRITEILDFFRHIGERLHSLKCLHVSSPSMMRYPYQRYETPYEELLSGFQTVICLKLNILDDSVNVPLTNFLISQCRNLKSLELGYIPVVNEHFFRNIVERNLLSNLEVFEFGGDISQDRCNVFIDHLITCCPKLRVIKGVEHKTVSNVYKGVRILT